jgi:hypothetical protein
MRSGGYQMITRISIPVSVEEREALRRLARQEMRDPREQVRYLLQQELVKRGILDKTNSSAVHILADNGAAVGVNQ